jgi:hypothetical protein
MKTYTVTVDDYKTVRWYLNDKLHREDGPAIEWSNGTREWYLHGKRVTENDVMTDNNQTIEIEGTKYTLAQIKNALKNNKND